MLTAPTEPHTEEHELPSIEAVIAGTLALMTGYSQAVQAEIDPAHRLRMGTKIGENLALLMDHPMLSLGFRQVAYGLRRRWQAMNDCTREAARDCACGAAAPAERFQAPAPKRLQ
ncbi:hypothetical protein [Rhizobacter sp. Root404]|uniref:hypothetical protein n=1 Tax=Rhizobacter sp. Root404 TaxID=1736528 RepID=UPI0006F7A08B|nr:hypothetical protein [Rhizobacter sp. Root404]KQW38148.1 hypothetical protein ASC76_08845 [Rhizobacter sp. Root404]